MSLKTIFAALVLALPVAATAQTDTYTKSLFGLPTTLNRAELAATGGSTGIGLEFSAAVNNNIGVRLGFDFMPKVKMTMNMDMMVGDQSITSLRGGSSDFDRMAAALEDFTGYQVNGSIDMMGEASFYNFKFLVDWHPFRCKDFYFTAGFSIGSSDLGEAYNSTADMPSLYNANMYNHFYNRVESDYYYYNPIFPGMSASLDPATLKDLQTRLANYGRMHISMGRFTRDVMVYRGIREVIDENGEAHRVPVYEYHRAGETYYMEPDENSMVRAYAKTRVFKPYLGLGYKHSIAHSDWSLGIDAGIWCWGGSPSFRTHEGVDMVHDLEDIPGKPGTYTRMLRDFKVWPVLNLRIVKRL